jgi:hypothetical protein
MIDLRLTGALAFLQLILGVMSIWLTLKPPEESSCIRAGFNCGKLVKLSPHGTEVLSLTPRHLQANLPKDIWQVLSPDLVF